MKMWRESERIRDNCECVTDEESFNLEIGHTETMPCRRDSARIP